MPNRIFLDKEVENFIHSFNGAVTTKESRYFVNAVFIKRDDLPDGVYEIEFPAEWTAVPGFDIYKNSVGDIILKLR